MTGTAMNSSVMSAPYMALGHVLYRVVKNHHNDLKSFMVSKWVFVSIMQMSNPESIYQSYKITVSGEQ